MSIIRTAQFESFRESGAGHFAVEMEEHIRAFAPELSRAAGGAGVRTAVRAGIARASGYGFTNRGTVRLYLETMCAFGSEFDTDPQYPWAADILGDGKESSQTRRACHLYRVCGAFLDETAGPDDSAAAMALDKALALAKALEADPQARPPNGDLASSITRGFEACYPSKFRAISESGLRLLVAQAIDTAGHHGVTSEFGQALTAAILFGFGHGAVRDPLYPWIGSALTDPLIPNADGRVARLFDRTRVYAQRMMEALG